MNIADVLFEGNTLGTKEVGVEIELEGRNLPTEVPMGWRVEHDGSLRGEAYEYVFRNPVPRERVPLMLERLAERIEANDSKIFNSGGAGVHVHINIRDLTREKLYNFICLYIIFEDVLVDYCGVDRVGNLFCLRVRDAEFLLDMLEKAIKSNNYRHLYTDDIRYASINCKAICQYGSLEFRAMRSTSDMAVINNWVKLLLTLKDQSKMFTDPRDIVSTMSWEGGENFAKKIFGDMLSCFPEVDWDARVYEGIRRSQIIAYASDWEEVKVCLNYLSV